MTRVGKVASFSIFLNLGLLFCELFDCKEWVFLVCEASSEQHLHTRWRRLMRCFVSIDFNSVKKLLTVFEIYKHYMISSVVRKKKTVCAYISKFCSASGVKICSVNLDCETTFLTLVVTHLRFWLRFQLL